MRGGGQGAACVCVGGGGGGRCGCGGQHVRILRGSMLPGNPPPPSRLIKQN